MDYRNLIHSLAEIQEEFQLQAIRAVNSSLTLRNWLFGWYITEFEQNGKDRALYGQKLLNSISKELRSLNIPNTDERELRRYRQFYLIYPAIYKLIKDTPLIRGMLPPISHSGKGSQETQNWEITVPDSHYSRLCSSVSYSHFVELIFVSQYLVGLPNKKDLENFIKSEMNKSYNQKTNSVD